MPNGKWLPLHITLIKSVSNTSEGQWSYLRLNLFVPGITTNITANMMFPYLKGPNGMFLRELTFKSTDSKYIDKTCKNIKETIKKSKQISKDTSEGSQIAKIEALHANKDRRVIMDHLTIRPNMTGKKTVGTLEAYANGVKFTSRQGAHVDINYTNVKHAFFQPCEEELVVLIHFNLHKAQLIGGKKTNNIQFYMEAGTLVDDLDNRKRKFYNDQEELEQEQRERENKIKLNQKFKKFSQNISIVAQKNKHDLEFDTPFSEISFSGAPGKSLVKLMPTVNCLVNLTEQPFFVVTLDDIELIHFERVHFQIKNFDMAIIYKDFNTFDRICSVPSEQLDLIKQWADQMDILYTEGAMAINWNNILSTIREDFPSFLENGGWAFFRDDQSNEGEESDSSSGFQDDLQEESGESSESDFSGDNESASSEEVEEPSDSEEQGVEWDELDRRALESDKKNASKYKEKEHKNR